MTRTTKIYVKPTPPQGLYSISDVADILKVHEDSIRRCERNGTLPEAKREIVSNQRYYTDLDVERMRDYFGQ